MSAVRPAIDRPGLLVAPADAAKALEASGRQTNVQADMDSRCGRLVSGLMAGGRPCLIQTQDGVTACTVLTSTPADADDGGEPPAVVGQAQGGSAEPPETKPADEAQQEATGGGKEEKTPDIRSSKDLFARFKTKLKSNLDHAANSGKAKRKGK